MEEEKRTLSDIFRDSREMFSGEIREGIVLLNNIKNIPEVQVTFLSLRQRLLEENHKLLEHFTKYKRQYRQRKGEEWANVSTIGQTHYQPTEKNHIVDSRLSALQERIEILKTQIDFYSESIKTVDSVLFGVKDRIAAQKLLDGN